MINWIPSYGLLEEQREDMHGVYGRFAVVTVRALDEENPDVQRVELQLAPEETVPEMGAWYRLLVEDALNFSAPIVLSVDDEPLEHTMRVRLENVSEIEARQLEARFQWV